MQPIFKVLVSDDLSPHGVALLRACPGVEVDVKVGMKPAELIAVIGGYDGLVIRSATKVTAEVLAAATRLKIVGRAGIGVDNVDVPAASRHGVIVENTPSGNVITTAEHAICLLLALARHIPQATASMKAGKWDKKKYAAGVELFEKTLGIAGLGNIGRIVADRARGLKMKVIAHDPFLGQEAADRLGVELVSLDELLTRADFITVHTPYSAETRGLIGAAAFAKMKTGVLLVNAARGGIVDEAALLAALESGKVAGAALDVFAKEPCDPADPLVLHERVITTPHLGASTDEAQEKVAIEVAEQFVAFITRGEVKNALNLASVSVDAAPRLAPWLDLASRLGALVAQIQPGLVDSGATPGIDELEIELSGTVAELGASPVARAVLTGLLRSVLGAPVNEVSAPLIASDRGLRVTEVMCPRGVNFSSSVTVTTRGAGGTRLVQGTIFHVGERYEARIVRIDEHVIDATPAGRILFLENADQPGVIGSVGTLLGARGINVARLHVGQDSQARRAVQLWNVEGDLTPALLAEVWRLPHVASVRAVVLPPCAP